MFEALFEAKKSDATDIDIACSTPGAEISVVWGNPGKAQEHKGNRRSGAVQEGQQKDRSHKTLRCISRLSLFAHANGLCDPSPDIPRFACLVLWFISTVTY